MDTEVPGVPTRTCHHEAWSQSAAAGGVIYHWICSSSGNQTRNRLAGASLNLRETGR